MKKIIIICLTLFLVVIMTSSLVLGADTGELIEVFRNKIILEVNSVRVATDNFLYKGTTYVPLRAVAELLGKNVTWNADTKVAAISEPQHNDKEHLSSLLPEKAGYTWMYDGFAEYGHRMTLDEISDEPGKRVYAISGEVYDPSDGESTLDRNVTLKYILEGDILRQEKTEQVMLDSKYDSLILIKTPLTAGTSWSEKAVDRNGAETTVNGLIKKVEIADNGSKLFTVRHEDANSSYYEERIIKEKEGIIAFEKLLELNDSSFPVSYFLFKGGEDVNRHFNSGLPSQ